MAVAVVLAGCGGSSTHAHISTSPPPAATHVIPTTTAAPASYPQTTSQAATSGASNVRLPASFTIGPGGKLTPPFVTAPAGVLIGLTLISGDGKLHHVTLGREVIAVPAGGRTYLALRGLAIGRHSLIVDGAPRGTLIVGGSVGP
jgi:hypothetical protein